MKRKIKIIIIFASLIIIPYNQIFDFDFIGINESELTTETYEECYFTFFNDYEKTNPMTKKEGIQNFMLKLEKDGLISRAEYSNIISNFQDANLMETYYKARKNIGSTMAQQAFANMGKLSTIRKRTNIAKKKTVLQTFKELSSRNQNALDMLMKDKKRKSKKFTNHEHIIEEHDKESESEFKSKGVNSINFSISDNNSIHETEKNIINRVNNSVQKPKKNDLNLKRRQNIVNFEEQQAILNLVGVYNNPLLFGLQNLCNNMNEDEDDTEESNESNSLSMSESGSKSESRSQSIKSSSSSMSFRTEEEKNNGYNKRGVSYVDNIKNVEEMPIINDDKKPQEKVKKKIKMKIHIKKKIKIKKKI